MPKSTPPCVDASIVLPLILPGEPSGAIDDLWATWLSDGPRPEAPALLLYEVTNAIHRYSVAGQVTRDQAERALEVAIRLDIHLTEDDDLHRRALVLALELGMSAAYDAHYLALAERLEAELWTCDARLHACAGKRFPRIRLVARPALRAEKPRRRR